MDNNVTSDSLPTICATPKRAIRSITQKIVRLIAVMACLFVLDVLCILLGWDLLVRTLADFLLVSLTICWLTERNE